MKRNSPVLACDGAKRAALLQDSECIAPRRRWSISLTSVREFLMAYCACFLAVLTFIA